ncbi:hypothetical protein BDZ89DRAFT_1057902 [Hymenopellis radicata]|nr:hypothetical protein BDZ89DRAFT_1057902 [Hymenopellis radicata]
MPSPLPLDVLCEVFRHVHALEDLKCARLACSGLRDIVSPGLFSDLEVVFFDFAPVPARRKLAFLTAIAEQKTAVGKYVKSLIIRHPFEARSNDGTIRRLWDRATNKEKRFFKKVASVLLSSIGTSRVSAWTKPLIVRDVNNITRMTSMYDRFNPVIRNLSRLPSLRHVVVSSACTQHAYVNHVDFSTFGGLEDFEYEDLSSGNAARDVPAVISKSPNLKRLQLGDWRLQFEEDVRLPTVRDLIPIPSLDRISLREFHIECVPIAPEDVSILLPYVKDATSLTFEATQVPNRLWELLSPGCARIKTGDAVVRDAFLNYIASYSGLELLDFVMHPLFEGEQENTRTWRFWMEILPHHYSSLRALVVTARVPGGWCLDDANFDALSLCHRLIELSITVDWAHISVGGPENIVRRLLNQLPANVWPDLKLLKLASIHNEEMRDMVHREFAVHRQGDYAPYSIEKIVTETRYDSLPEPRRSMELTVDRSFTLRESDDESGTFIFHQNPPAFWVSLFDDWEWVE